MTLKSLKLEDLNSMGSDQEFIHDGAGVESLLYSRGVDRQAGNLNRWDIGDLIIFGDPATMECRSFMKEYGELQSVKLVEVPGPVARDYITALFPDQLFIPDDLDD